MNAYTMQMYDNQESMSNLRENPYLNLILFDFIIFFLVFTVLKFYLLGFLAIKNKIATAKSLIF